MNEYDARLLKKCPFCNGVPEIVSFVKRHTIIRDKECCIIKCQRCGAKTREVEESVHYSARQSVIGLWNARNGVEDNE